MFFMNKICLNQIKELSEEQKDKGPTHYMQCDNSNNSKEDENDDNNDNVPYTNGRVFS